jgi:hypothetical protein
MIFQKIKILLFIQKWERTNGKTAKTKEKKWWKIFGCEIN